MNCEHCTNVRHLHSVGKGSKIGCMGTAYSKPKPQNTEGGNMCISACSLSISSWTTSTIPILYRYWWREICLYANITKRKEWLSPKKKKKRKSPYEDLRASTKDNVICIWWNSEGVLYYELLPRIAIITSDIYCQQLRRLADAIQ